MGESVWIKVSVKLRHAKLPFIVTRKAMDIGHSRRALDEIEARRTKTLL